MSKSLNKQSERRPILMIVVGRQRVGKTTFMNTVLQKVKEEGAEPAIWNADLLNVSYSISLFHPEVIQPPSAGFEDVKGWLERRIEDQIEGQYDAFLDAAGGETAFTKLVGEVPIVQTLEELGIRTVLVHLIGPEQADVDYLERFTSGSILAPEATLIVLNEGLILAGRSPGTAFAEIVQHPAVTAAVRNGAHIVVMPALSCMSQVTDRGLTFAEAIKGISKDDRSRLSHFDRQRVTIWWRTAVPRFMSQIPPLWLPATNEDRIEAPPNPGGNPSVKQEPGRAAE